MKKQFIALTVLISSLVLGACSENKEKDLNDMFINTEDHTIEEVVRSYFDKHEWKYNQYMDEDSITSFLLGFNGHNERMDVKIIIFPDQSMYQIIGQADTVLPENAVNKGVVAMNRYNLSAVAVGGCIASDGRIVFWLGRNIVGGTFSELDLMEDLDQVVAIVDNKTAQIFKQAVTTDM